MNRVLGGAGKCENLVSNQGKITWNTAVRFYCTSGPIFSDLCCVKTLWPTSRLCVCVCVCGVSWQITFLIMWRFVVQLLWLLMLMVLALAMGKWTDLLVCHIPFHSEYSFWQEHWFSARWPRVAQFSLSGRSVHTPLHKVYSHTVTTTHKSFCETCIQTYFWLKIWLFRTSNAWKNPVCVMPDK